MKKKIKINGETFSEFLSEKKIQKKVSQIGKKIEKEYSNKRPVFIGVLNGASIFLADLIRNINIDLEIDFIKLSSYGDEKFSSGSVKLLKDVDAHIGGKDVLIVEDIVDTGLSVSFIKKHLITRNPKSIKIVSLLHKKNKSANESPNYVGFEIKDLFVIGYGLDYAQKYRNLKSIYILDSK